MSKVKQLSQSQLIRTTFSLLLNTGLTSIIGFAFWKVASSSYTTSQVGQATTLMALTGVSTLLAVSGLAPAILLALSSKSDKIDYKKATHGFVLIAAATAATISLILQTVLISFFKEYNFLQNFELIILVVLISAVTAGGVMLDSVSGALHRSGLIPTRNVSQSVIKVVLLFPFIMLSLQAPYAVIAATILGGVTASTYVMFKISGRLYPKKGDISLGWMLVKDNMWHHQAASLGAQLPPVVVPLIMTAALGTSDSAIFSIAWMFGALFFTISPSVSSAMIISTANMDNVNIKLRIKQASIVIGSLVSIPMIVTLMFPEYLMGFFGPQYAEGAMLLVLLALSAMPDSVTNIAVAFLRLKKDLKPATILNVSMGLSTVFITLTLIPLLGDKAILAPGIAWLASQTLGSIAILTYIQSRYIKNANKENQK